jgi:hypothetical protein
MVDVSELKDKIVNNPLEKSVLAIGQAIHIVDEVSDIILQGLETTDDRFIYTEQISLFFDKYLKKLRNLLDGKDPDLAFWAASLLMHYKLNDILAEKILLEAIELGDDDSKASVATVILCRNRNQKVAEAITKRLNNKNPDKKMRDYFNEYLEIMRGNG